MSMRCILLLACLWCAEGGMAQWGVHGTLLHHERMTGRHGLHWLVGISHDASDRTTIGLDLIGHANLMGTEDYTEQNSYLGYDLGYSFDRKVIGMQYRSTYFLSNDNAGAYLGTYVGFRMVSRRIELDYAYSVNNSGFNQALPAWARSASTEATLFPAGLRFGFRSEMDGYFADAYVGLGYQFGTGSGTVAPAYLAEKDQLKGFSFQVGYTVGMGWD